jgi:hypothetical protein
MSVSLRSQNPLSLARYVISDSSSSLHDAPALLVCMAALGARCLSRCLRVSDATASVTCTCAHCRCDCTQVAFAPARRVYDTFGAELPPPSHQGLKQPDAHAPYYSATTQSNRVPYYSVPSNV